MNAVQKVVLILGCLVAVGMIVLPPWSDGSYALVFDRPESAIIIDVFRLGVQLVLVATVCGALVLAAKSGKGKDGLETTPSVPLIVSTALGLALIGFGASQWHAANKERKRQAQLAALQRVNDEQASAIAAERAKLKNLGAERRWKPEGNPTDKMDETVITSWESGKLFYRLELSGTPENLEYGIDAHPTFYFALTGPRGARVLSLSVDSQSLKPKKNKAGAIVSYSSRTFTELCSEKQYVDVIAMKAVNVAP